MIVFLLSLILLTLFSACSFLRSINENIKYYGNQAIVDAEETNGHLRKGKL